MRVPDESRRSINHLPKSLYEGFTGRMSTPIPTRFSDDEIDSIDRLVNQDIAPTRSELIRYAVHLLDDAVRRAAEGEVIADSYGLNPRTEDDVASAQASADALVEAEPW